PAGVRGENAPVAELEPLSGRRPHRVDAAGAGSAGLGRGRVHLPDLRGDADHAGFGIAPRGRADRHRRARAGGRSVVTAEREPGAFLDIDRKSTRLNSSHVKISYAVFCLKKKTNSYIKFLKVIYIYI